MELVSQQQQELDRKATQVERRWRQALQDEAGGAREQALMNEYLALLHARNALTRQEMRLSLARRLAEHERDFGDVQRQLAALLQVGGEGGENDALVEALLERLTAAVNARDQLLQQMLAEEADAAQDAQLASDALRPAAVAATVTSAEACCLQ